MVLQIVQLKDADLTRRTDAMRTAVLRLLRAFSANPAELTALEKPLSKLLDMAAFEADRLADSWEGEQRNFARRRYIAKLTALSNAFETRVRKQRSAAGRDAFELEADLLLDRMARESAA